MADTRGSIKAVVWAHNSHLGEDTYTLSSHQFNMGKLVKKTYPSKSVISIGQYCHEGEVTAVSNWGEAERIFPVVKSNNRSFENIFHQVSTISKKPSYCVDMREPSIRDAMGSEKKLQRAIGVIYRPGNELVSHYYPSTIAKQFDILVWFDRTRALSRIPLKSAMKMVHKMM
jgi:erythromycin esterase-like protein